VKRAYYGSRSREDGSSSYQTTSASGSAIMDKNDGNQNEPKTNSLYRAGIDGMQTGIPAPTSISTAGTKKLKVSSNQIRQSNDFTTSS
jgi:hypothetical protein